MKNETLAIRKWINGIPYEKAFWNNVYRWKATFEAMMRWANYNKVISLEEFDANTFLISRKSNPKVLDVGCGMSYATGNYIEQNNAKKILDIHYIDPLANEFNRILKRYHKNLPTIEFGMVEFLSALVPEKDVDLIIIQNALDHSAMPVKGIFEAFAILSIGGILYLNHHPNEAETEQYKGFHQFNIDEDKGTLIIWNKSEKYVINELLGNHAKIKVCRHENGHIIAIIEKISDFLLTNDVLNNDRKLLCNSLIWLSEELKISQALKQEIKYYFYNSIQFFVQALPWETKMKIKKLIKQA